MRTLALAVALLLSPVVAGAQSQGTGSNWDAWLGCWELVLENARDAAVPPNPARRPLTQPRDSTRPQVCVEASGNGAILTTRVANQPAIQQTVIADGLDHPISDADCHGTQRAEWSKNGKRLYSRAELACGADKGNRRVSGFSILGANGTWTDIQAVDVSGQQTVRVRNYRRVTEAARIGDGLMRATPLTLEDVEEAAGKVSARALEAALVETSSAFDLSGKDMLALHDANVPPSVTDLMIALSYPDRFVIERTTRADFGPAVSMIDEPFFLGWAFGYPMWSGFYSPFYGAYYSQFYSPFYSYLPWYDLRYFGGGAILINDGGGGSGAPNQPSGAGRVVDGRGYTRVRPREADPTPTAPVGSSRGSISSSSGGSAPSSGGGGGGSVSSSGFSSGGSGGDGGGRTAQPR